jgi:hypothetical protein
VIVKPLTRLAEEKQWSSEVQATFQSLKEAFCTAPTLAYLQPGETFIVDTDMNNVRTGVLSHIQDRNYCVIH